MERPSSASKPASTCSVCGHMAEHWEIVDNFPFTKCGHCGSIALTVEYIRKIDAGENLRQYDRDYWQSEIRSAKERCWGSSIARAAESILLSRREVKAFVDLGCGSGDLLDAMSFYLPSSRRSFFGVEMYPPDEHSLHPGFIRASVSDVDMKFDSGVCVEVIEHLTPKMLDQLISGLAKCSNENSFFIFNTGLAPYVENEDRNYIDPVRRGHIVSYGWDAITYLFAQHGFVVRRLGNRDWAFGAEFMPNHDLSMSARIWNPLPENSAFLSDPMTGTVLQILARESMRAYE